MSAGSFAPRPEGRCIDLLVLVGPSGAGKSTLITQLREDFPSSFGYSVSHTTRDCRPGEVNGVNYHFVSHAAFEQRVAENGFMEHAIVHGTRYGTSFQSLRDVLDKDQIVCMDLDIVGAHNVRKLAEQGYRSMVVWVCPPSFEVLEYRLRNRGTDSEDKIRTRLQSAVKEMTWKAENEAFFDGIFVNDDLPRCYSEFRDFIIASCFSRPSASSALLKSSSPIEAIQHEAASESDAGSTPPNRSSEPRSEQPYHTDGGNSPVMQPEDTSPEQIERVLVLASHQHN